VHYYDDEHLARFGELGRFKPDLAKQFFDYYGAATGTDGALSKREKALIALAVAHAQRCPYCIDAWTKGCLEAGSNPDEMTEAVHVAAAMQAGITLVHGMQMHGHLDHHGA
jgi:alkylhydroperoxidase/carboxymuconolactone decarboxylase family protein